MPSSSKRARELARARYERQQQRRARRAQRQRQRRIAVAAAGSIVVVALLVWAVAALVGGRTTTQAAAAASASPTASASASTAALRCPPVSTAKPTPMSFPKAPPLSIDRSATYQVTLDTNCGKIVMDLFPGKAPVTVNSFLFLAGKRYFDNSVCHRVTGAADGIYVLQCGDPTGTGNGGPGYTFGIENAPANGDYPAGTVAMARTSDPNSNGSQFFIAYQDTKLPTTGGGYTIFGKVVSGLDIVAKIGAAGPDPTRPPYPKIPIQIQSISVVKLAKGATS